MTEITNNGLKQKKRTNQLYDFRVFEHHQKNQISYLIYLADQLFFNAYERKNISNFCIIFKNHWFQLMRQSYCPIHAWNSNLSEPNHFKLNSIDQYVDILATHFLTQFQDVLSQPLYDKKQIQLGYSDYLNFKTLLNQLKEEYIHLLHERVRQMSDN